MTIRSPLGMALLVASSLGLVACGGAFRSENGNEGGSSSAGTGSQAGTASAGKGSSAGTGSGGSATGRKSCVYGGKTYADGVTFMSTDGCNSCSCNDGEVGCDERACVDGCVYLGKQYAPGEPIPAGDGCNTCSCGPDGLVGCTTIACPSCGEELHAAYGAVVEKARKCDPKGAEQQCRGMLSGGLQCGCSVFVNEANAEAIAEARTLAMAFSSQGCITDIACGACATASQGYCSAAGVCETLWQEGPQACKVGGVVYPDGATNIADPTSCNKCSCSNGKLICTEINCPSPCPPDRVLATQCAACGPADECLIVEHACLPTCSESTPGCTCVDGVCRNYCG